MKLTETEKAVFHTIGRLGVNHTTKILKIADIDYVYD